MSRPRLFSGKRARPTIPLRGSRSSSMFQLQQQQQQQTPVHTPGALHSQDPFASSSDVTLDDLTTSNNQQQQNNQQRDIFTHSSASLKAKVPRVSPPPILHKRQPALAQGGHLVRLHVHQVR